MTAEKPQTIFVAGATGKQGSAVTKSLLSKGFNVKALARNAVSAPAQILEKLGAEIVTGDLNDPASFADHLKTSDGLFCVLTFKNGVDIEIKQGFRLATQGGQYDEKHY